MNDEILGGRYKVVRLLGQGGMGAVYEAAHTGTGRRVAIKVITADVLKNPTLISRFEVEAKAAGKIESQHIASVLDAGTDESGAPFLVMEYLTGFDLLHLLQEKGPLPVQLALKIAAQACLGLEKAHNAKIIHRDIKPANIYLSERDGDEVTVKLLDFGVAKIRMDDGSSDNNSLTRTGSLLGSPLYMAPEQARGSKTIDHRADLWSLGIVLYQALSGRTPYDDIDALGALIIAICAEAPPPVQEYAPWVPPEVTQVVQNALTLNPEDRYQTAGQMYRAIKALLVGGHSMEKSMLVTLSDEERAIVAESVKGLPPLPLGASTGDGTPREPPAGPQTLTTGPRSRLSITPGGSSKEGVVASAATQAGDPLGRNSNAKITSAPGLATNDGMISESAAPPLPAPKSRTAILLAGVGLVAIGGALIGMKLGGPSQPPPATGAQPDGRATAAQTVQVTAAPTVTAKASAAPVVAPATATASASAAPAEAAPTASATASAAAVDPKKMPTGGNKAVPVPAGPAPKPTGAAPAAPTGATSVNGRAIRDTL